jgi:hypothetical protein
VFYFADGTIVREETNPKQLTPAELDW